MIKFFNLALASALCIVAASTCFASEALFYKTSRNYGWEGRLGDIFSRVLESRMFSHGTWQQRLYANSYNPDIDETFEIYRKADGSSRLSYRRAIPSLSRIIEVGVREGKQVQIQKEMQNVAITTHDVIVPPLVATELGQLWRTMLPGSSRAPAPPAWGSQALTLHAPAFVALARNDGSVIAGRVANSAYDNDAYRLFVDILGDIGTICDRCGGLNDPLWIRLPGKIRKLRALLST